MPDVLLRLRLSDLKPQWLPAMLTLLHCIHFGARSCCCCCCCFCLLSASVGIRIITIITLTCTELRLRLLRRLCGSSCCTDANFAVQRAVAGVSSPCLLRLDLSLPFSPSLCLYRVTCRVHFGPSPTCVLCVHCCATRRIRILRIRIRILVNIMANYAQFRGCSFH